VGAILRVSTFIHEGAHTVVCTRAASIKTHNSLPNSHGKLVCKLEDPTVVSKVQQLCLVRFF